MPDTRQTPLQMHRFIIGIVIRGIRMIYKNSLTKGNSHSGMVVANVACFRASFLVGVPCITGKILKAAYHEPDRSCTLRLSVWQELCNLSQPLSFAPRRVSAAVMDSRQTANWYRGGFVGLRDKSEVLTYTWLPESVGNAGRVFQAYFVLPAGAVNQPVQYKELGYCD